MVKRKSGKLRPTKSAKKKLRLQGKLRKAIVPKGVIRDAWDANLTSVQNIERIGLTASVNSVKSVRPDSRAARAGVVGRGRVESGSQETASEPRRVDVLEALEKDAARPEKVSKQYVRPGEEMALREMIAAHGDDYESMARDIKRNYFQFTPAQLRRKCERRARILGLEASTREDD